ncbi:sodium/proton antiporter (NhaA family) [Homoserinimonas aerilata]|uniref:Na(+)/H(+) antiporter NhaA n=1 Tax=Homoserinimonas aerilata TaxID=1162970 RepID=A0A542XWZ9_9MICO|nr:Na+/H+ antiporter NhaA [Homoserinimonas aerilata]TQL40358.1 sodium/proton antiporter (NhaA family) [Homoserinimonas aerilata]
MPTTSKSSQQPPRILARRSWGETLRIGEILRKETVGGGLLVAAAIVAIVWANSPLADSYFAARDFTFGFAPWGLELSVGTWAADGLLAIFFFLVGLELKKEFVAGDLRQPSKAIVPVAAAFGGVAAPALIYAAINWGDPEALRGWATPTATDIAFAVAVLAVIGSHLPSALRIFLLTLAVVDDLIAIVIIAFFYTSEIQVAPLLLTLVPVIVYTVLVQRFRRFFGAHAWAPWLILLPIGAIAWALLHASGVHATIAGVVLGFTVPVLHRRADRDSPERDTDGPGLAEQFEHAFRPLSAGFAVPVFAFFAAGVTVGGVDGFVSALSDPVTLGIIVALVVGKPIGILGTTWLLSTVTRARLDDDVRWIDLLGVSLLAGIGFTVSLLVAELSFGHGLENDHAKVGILCASVLAAVLATVVLRIRNRHYRRIQEEEAIDENADGIPDVYQR